MVGARGIPGIEGGAEKNAENIFPHFAAEHDVQMICLAEYCKDGQYKNITIARVPTWRLFGTDKIFYYLFSLVKATRCRPDIIHCQGLNAAFFLWYYRWVARRVVVRYGSADYVNAKWGPIGKLGFRWCEWQLRWADAVIAVTASLRERLRCSPGSERVIVIPNPVDEPEVGADDAAVTRFGLVPGTFVLAVGRITWQKDFETLIGAFEAVKARTPGIGKLVIVGGDDGSGYGERLRAIASEDVVFTGRLARTEVGGLFAACRLYVNSSRHEGLSNAILEAISFRRPVLVSDIVENRDLPLAPHQFFKCGDVEALAHALRAVLADPETFVVDRARFATWPDVVASTRHLYERLLAAPRGDAVPAIGTTAETGLGSRGVGV